MILLNTIFIAANLFSGATPQIKGPDPKAMLAKELEQMQAKDAAASQAKKEEETSDVLLITPEARALDYKQAFDLIRKEKAAVNVSFKLKNGKTISNILEMQVMGKGTLIIFKTNTTKGIQIIVSKVEDIVSLTHT